MNLVALNSVADQYDRARRPLSALLASVPDGAWSAPSPCEGWTARDVVVHLVETQRSLFADRGVELGTAPDVSAEPAVAWQEHSQQVADAIADDAVVGIEYEGWFGPTTLGATLEQFYVWDMLVHRWDVATAVGADAGLTDAELDRVEQGAEGFGDALYMDGICRPAVEPPADADRSARVLARLGRRADV